MPSISHITFIVKNLEKSAALFARIFNAQEVYSSGEKTFSFSKEKYLLVQDLWICLMHGEPMPDRSYNHIAFKIDDADFDNYLRKIREMNLEIAPPRKRVSGEGRSLYFYDYDHHLFELHTGTLNERLRRYTSDG